MQASAFIAVSLDGYIARPDGGLDWLDEANQMTPAGEDCGFTEFFGTVDVLVMGRKTYEKVLTFGQWPYGDTRVIVLGRDVIRFPDELAKTVSWQNLPPEELYRDLSEQGVKRAYIDGGITIQHFLAAGLMDDLTITVIPVLLGSGIPLWGKLARDVPLKLVESKSYDFGFVQSKYKVIKQP